MVRGAGGALIEMRVARDAFSRILANWNSLLSEVCDSKLKHYYFAIV